MIVIVLAFVASALLSLGGVLSVAFGSLGFGVALLIVVGGVAAGGAAWTLRNRHAVSLAATARSVTVAWTMPWLFLLLAVAYGALFNR